MSDWRLPRSTPSIWNDRRAAAHALATASTDDQRAACLLRLADVEARQVEVHRRQAEQLRRAVEVAASALRPLFDAMAAAARLFVENTRAVRPPRQSDYHLCPPPLPRPSHHTHGPAPRPGRRSGNVPGARS